jgi:hypothetical protein
MSKQPDEKIEAETKQRHANHGGKRDGSGRKKGTPNKVTAEIKVLAHKYGPDALKELARLARSAESEAARVAACREILDRAYGKAIAPNVPPTPLCLNSSASCSLMP